MWTLHPLFILLLSLLVFTPCLSLSPNGTHVCGGACERLEWRDVPLTRSCGYPHFDQICTFNVRQPVVYTTTCYECCEGWRQSDEENCNTECVTGTASITSCKDLPDGWYQLCDSCQHFAHCVSGQLSRQPCLPQRHWDDYSKKCVKHSQTCQSKEEPEARYRVQNQPKPTTDDEMNELTNQIEPVPAERSYDGGCENIKCESPGRCIPVYTSDAYRLQAKCVCPRGTRLTSEGKCEGIDECEERDPCGEHGTCTDRKYSYKCRCDPSWRGRHCNKPRRRRRRKYNIRKEVHRHIIVDDPDDIEWDAPSASKFN